MTDNSNREQNGGEFHDFHELPISGEEVRDMRDESSHEYHPIYQTVIFVLVSVLVFPASGAYPAIPIGTFSIIAYDSLTGEIGGAVQSKVLAVGRSVLHVLPGIGAIATQARSNYSYGPDGLELLRLEIPVETVVEVLTSKDEQREVRQLGVVNVHSKAASFTGVNCSSWAGHRTGPGYAIQGNILASELVVSEMERAFLETTGSLAERLLSALEAGQAAGGDSRGKQSSAIIVQKEGFLHFIDLRVDDHEAPIRELIRLYGIHRRSYEPGDRISAADRFFEHGEIQRAEYELEQTIKIAEQYPDDADLLNNVAWGLALHDRMLDKALEFAEHAVVLEPEAGYIWDTLGEVHYRKGDLRKAIEAQTKAVEFAPDESIFKERLEAWEKEY